MKPTKQQICQLLDAWIRQRPGLDYGNYGDPVAYRAEVRSIGKDLAHARILLRAVELDDSITAEDMLEGFRAYSGRLSIHEKADKPGSFYLDYCTGQYWPTEYRRAACAVLSSILWAHKRDNAPVDAGFTERHSNLQNLGEYLRDSFRREYGRSIADRWFD